MLPVGLVVTRREPIRGGSVPASMRLRVTTNPPGNTLPLNRAYSNKLIGSFGSSGEHSMAQAAFTPVMAMSDSKKDSLLSKSER